MEYGKTLIDSAGKKCGSFYKLSKETGFPQSHISDVRSGKRALPLEWVPVLAELAGVDARDALARVMAERLPEGSRARAILGGVLAAGVAALLLLCVVLGPLMPSTGYAAQSGDVTKLYIVECVRALRRLFFMARGLLCGALMLRPRNMGWMGRPGAAATPAG